MGIEDRQTRRDAVFALHADLRIRAEDRSAKRSSFSGLSLQITPGQSAGRCRLRRRLAFGICGQEQHRRGKTSMLALTGVYQTASASDKKSADGEPLRVTVNPTHGRIVNQPGGSSYSRTDGISARDTRRFMDPPGQSPSRPFDSDLFFTTPDAPRGDQSPYMHCPVLLTGAPNRQSMERHMIQSN